MKPKAVKRRASAKRVANARPRGRRAPKPRGAAKATRAPKPRGAAKAKTKAKPRASAKAKTRASAKAKTRASAKAKTASTPKRLAKATPAAKAKPAAPTPRLAAAAHPPVSDWRTDLRAAIAQTGPDFAAFLRATAVAAPGWHHADTPELAGLEHWGTELAKRDLRTGVAALVRTAQYGLPIALDRGGIGIDGMGFKASEPSADGAPVETQIALAAAWLDRPDQPHYDAVATGIDRGRQLQIWDDDLIPNDDRAHWWYLDVGQCCSHAITRAGGTPSGHSYYEWPPETCVGRGLVIAVRGLRYPRANVASILGSVRDALVA